MVSFISAFHSCTYLLVYPGLRAGLLACVLKEQVLNVPLWEVYWQKVILRLWTSLQGAVREGTCWAWKLLLWICILWQTFPWSSCAAAFGSFTGSSMEGFERSTISCNQVTLALPSFCSQSENWWCQSFSTSIHAGSGFAMQHSLHV